jgi:hypothetical protein
MHLTYLHHERARQAPAKNLKIWKTVVFVQCVTGFHVQIEKGFQVAHVFVLGMPGEPVLKIV